MDCTLPQRQQTHTVVKLTRTAFETSRLLDFCSPKELTAQTGHNPDEWPLVILKELLDNALDACEEAGVAPDIRVTVADDGITIRDNGPGIPAGTVEGILDYSVRVSSREAYVSPTRGAQGNALKTILAMPHALDGSHGRVDISAHGQRHEITFAVDQIRQQPVIVPTVHKAGNVKTGTTIKMWWPISACSILAEAEARFLQLANDYTFLNPHLSLTVDWFGKRTTTAATNLTWRKWLPSEPTSAHWYRPAEFERLVSAYVAHDQIHDTDRSVREFVKEFRGLSATAKQRKVLEDSGLARTTLAALANGNGLQHDIIGKLLSSMQAHSKPVKSASLGSIGKAHIQTRLEQLGCELETFEYKKVAAVDDDGLPLVIEAAFAWRGNENEEQRRLITGVNFSPGIVNPFRTLGDGYRIGLGEMLEDRRAGDDEPIIFLLHIASPRVRYTDRGKSAVVMSSLGSTTITKSIEAVTAKWTKQRKQENREVRARQRRRDALVRRRSTSIKDAAAEAIPPAYLKVSGGRLPAKARQMYYAARGPILEATGRDSLDQNYFSQTLVPQYVEQHPEVAAAWDIVFDARGTFREPHGRTVPLGTLEVRSYLAMVDAHHVPALAVGDFLPPIVFPTCGPKYRISALLFVEKEGFNELFRAVHLAERYDLAILSSKGVSVTAARHLIDELCGRHGIPLLVLHDFDKSGLTIAATLQRDTRRYTFRHTFDVIDLGVRLADVRACGLDSEPVNYGLTNRGDPIDPRPNLRKNSATEEEIDFLCNERRQDGYRGARVELNSFTSPALIAWVERALEKNGIKKVIPDDKTLEVAYRRAVQIEAVREQLTAIVLDGARQAEQAALPKNLAGSIGKALKVAPAQPWDQALAVIAAANCKKRNILRRDSACSKSATEAIVTKGVPSDGECVP